MMQVFKQIKSLFFWRCAFAELLSSTLYCYTITSVTLRTNQSGNIKLWRDSSEVLNISLAIGFAVSAISFVFKIQDGGYINPAVTFGHFTSWRNNFIETITYLVTQMIGGVAGTGIVYSLIEDHNDLSYPHLNVSKLKGCTIEGILTFLVVMVTLAATDKKRNENDTSSCIIYGFAVAATHLVGIRYTGCVLNPARIFGLAIITNNWPQHIWIYWAGPSAAGIIAGVLYGAFFSVSNNNSLQSSYNTIQSPEQYKEERHILPKKTFDVNPNDLVMMTTSM